MICVQKLSVCSDRPVSWVYGRNRKKVYALKRHLPYPLDNEKQLKRYKRAIVSK